MLKSDEIEGVFRENGINLKVNSLSVVGGGSISEAQEVKTDKGSFFLKSNDSANGLAMFQSEADGLKRLMKASTLDVAEVIALGKIKDRSFILLNFLQKGIPSDDFWTDFGGSLADLHRHTNEKFGLEVDNYIASLEQKNAFSDSWSEFFILQRIEVLLRRAADEELADNRCVRKFNALFPKLESLFPSEKPSLLHGDLWSGNFTCTNQGRAAIFDPAIYYGHREMDIAMTRLFGGFEAGFYQAYNESYPMEKGWKERIDICNLYPRLVHLILFGRSYLPGILHTLSKFT